MNAMVWIGFILGVLSVPLALSLVPPNPVYGLRTSASCSSREVWFAANRFTGRLAVVGGMLLVLAGLISETRTPAGALFARDDVQMVCVVGVVLGVTVAGVLRARRLAANARRIPATV